MRRTLVLALLLSFTMVIALQAQLPANLDCKCTATGDGEYLCKCVAAKGGSEIPKNTAAPTPSTAATATTTPTSTPTTTALKSTETPATSTTPAAKGTETPTGTTTASGQPIYTGPRGGQYHYSSSGKKVYTRKK
jgi:hypothetical protein